MWGEDSSTNSSWFPFSPPNAFQGFYLSSADRKAGRERAEPVTSSQQMLLQQRIPRCPGGIHAGGKGRLPALMGDACLTAADRAPGTSFQHITSHRCHRARLHPESIRAWAVPGLRALGMIQQQEVLDNRLSPQQLQQLLPQTPQQL